MSRKIKLEEATQPVAKSEILQVADMVARDKEIDRDEILAAMEQAILKTAQLKYGEEKSLEAHINRKTGEVEIYRSLTVVEKVTDFDREISIHDARRQVESIAIGDTFKDRLPAVDFGRVAAQSARQIIVQRIKLAERNKQYKDFSEKVGEIITGTVKRVEYSDIVLDIGRTEGIIKKTEIIPNEVFKIGDRIKVYLAGLNKDPTGPLLFLSRTNPEFLKKLFEQEVPEIYDGTIKIMAVTRDPGSKAKVAVTTNDQNLDPVGACVGVKGSRVQAVVDELKGEKIDIVAWSDNPAIFIVNSLSPADVSKIVMEETGNRVTAVVPDDQLSAAIGRRGQNVRLASRLTGWTISVTTETDEAQARAKESARILKHFMDGLDVDEMVGHLLAGEGYSSIDEIANSPLSEIATIEGFDEDLAEEIRQRATAYVARKKEEVAKLCKEKGVDQELINCKWLSLELLEALVNSDIKKLDDLGDLATDELLEISNDLLSKPEAEALIMKIRENWFK